MPKISGTEKTFGQFKTAVQNLNLLSLTGKAKEIAGEGNNNSGNNGGNQT
jgi:hypothetical protein